MIGLGEPGGLGQAAGDRRRRGAVMRRHAGSVPGRRSVREHRRRRLRVRPIDAAPHQSVRPLDRARRRLRGTRPRLRRRRSLRMPRILFADYDYPDLELERELFAPPGIDVVAAQCKTEDDVIAAARGCCGILLQYAPITERVVAALPELGIVSRIGAGFDTVDTRGLREARRLGRELARLRRRRSRDARARAGARARSATSSPTTATSRAGNWHFLSSGHARAAARADARHRRPRPHRQAHGAHLAATCSSASSRSTRT